MGPPLVRFNQIVIDCADPRSLADFWRRVMGYNVVHANDNWVTIEATDESMAIGFQRVPEPKAGKNRLHIDLGADDEQAAARDIESMGAERRWVSDKPGDPFIVLADPEGNEFCVVRDAG